MKNSPTLTKILSASNTKNEYKLRAECLADVQHLMAAIHCSDYKVKGLIVPDVELEFSSALSLDEIKAAMKDIPDSHVMLETVAAAKDYNGERTQE